MSADCGKDCTTLSRLIYKETCLRQPPVASTSRNWPLQRGGCIIEVDCNVLVLRMSWCYLGPGRWLLLER